jgi:hypothetical protein
MGLVRIATDPCQTSLAARQWSATVTRLDYYTRNSPNRKEDLGREGIIQKCRVTYGRALTGVERTAFTATSMSLCLVRQCHILSLRATEGSEAISCRVGDCFVAEFILSLPKGSSQ